MGIGGGADEDPVQGLVPVHLLLVRIVGDLEPLRCLPSLFRIPAADAGQGYGVRSLQGFSIGDTDGAGTDDPDPEPSGDFFWDHIQSHCPTGTGDAVRSRSGGSLNPRWCFPSSAPGSLSWQRPHALHPDIRACRPQWELWKDPGPYPGRPWGRHSRCAVRPG